MIVELLPRVHLVGSGRLGFSTTNDYDCNVYLLVGDGDAVLVDAGCGLDSEGIVRNVMAVGGPAVSRLLLTHAHADHAAGARELAARLGAEIWASPQVADILEAGDSARSNLVIAKRGGIYPPDVQLRPTRVSRRLEDGIVTVGDLVVEVVASPGHACGHLCFLAQLPECRALLSGDAVFARGRVVLLATPDTDIGALARTVAHLRGGQPDALLPGHCEPVLKGATRHLDMANICFQRGAIPPPLT